MDLTRLKRGAYGRLFGRRLLPFPDDAVVPLDTASHVLLRFSRRLHEFQPQLWSKEVAFAEEMAARGRQFGVSDDPGEVFGKTVMWYHRDDVVKPRLWNYSKQMHQLIAGLEEQGNEAFNSAAEVLFWENNAFMHRRLDEIGTPTPRTQILTAETWRDADFSGEPLLVKQEHSASSKGLWHFPTAAEARRFLEQYAFRPGESVILQEVVRGATKDLRLTMVGDQVVESASYWRVKSPEKLAGGEWTTTATSNGSTVVHADIPETGVAAAAHVLRTLGVRTAGFDLMWVDDDVSAPPVVLEFSPLYEPNPPKPRRYDDWSYKRFKANPFVADGYFAQQHRVFRDIAGQVLDQGMI
jgi:glutathione synthase/RimK-type ligase-like ATP-grasp enzyme